MWCSHHMGEGATIEHGGRCRMKGLVSLSLLVTRVGRAINKHFFATFKHLTEFTSPIESVDTLHIGISWLIVSSVEERWKQDKTGQGLVCCV